MAVWHHPPAHGTGTLSPVCDDVCIGRPGLSLPMARQDEQRHGTDGSVHRLFAGCRQLSARWRSMECFCVAVVWHLRIADVHLHQLRPAVALPSVRQWHIPFLAVVCRSVLRRIPVPPLTDDWLAECRGWHLDGSIWQIPFHRSCYHHPFVRPDMAGQNDSRRQTCFIVDVQDPFCLRGLD